MVFFLGTISSSHWGELTQLWWEVACFQCWFIIPMKKSWSWGGFWRRAVSRQQRTSVRGSVKTSAREELEKTSSSWIGAVWYRGRPPSVAHRRGIFSIIRSKPAARTRCANGVFSALAVPSGPIGLGAWGQRSPLLDLFFKGNVLWLRRGLSSDKKQSDSRLYSHSVQLRYKVGDSVSPPLCVSFNVTFV